MIALAGTSYEARANAAVPSHCRADEVNYFSCQIEGGRKVISLCGPSVSPGSDPAAGLEYRNGRPSSVALTLPPPKNNRPANFFRGEHLNPHGENLVVDSVLFEFDGVSYGIVVRDGRNKFTGAWTVGGRKKYEERPCTEKVDHGLFLDLVLELPLP
jgi:hypothetical protein